MPRLRYISFLAALISLSPLTFGGLPAAWGDDDSICENCAQQRTAILPVPGSQLELKKLGNLPFRELALELDIPVNEKGKCFYKRKQLVKMERAIREKKPSMDPEELKKLSPHWDCVMLKHQLDSDRLKGCTPSPAAVFDHKASASSIDGKAGYYKGIIKKGYRYDIMRDAHGTRTVKVRIAFRGEPTSSPEVMKSLREKLALASDLWTKNSPDPKLKFSFEPFDESEPNTHFKVALNRKDGSITYDKAWGYKESWETIAHEVGHMLGLVDEFKIARSMLWQVGDELNSRQCSLNNLMCNPLPLAGPTAPHLYHYYMILRRGLCQE